MPVTGNTSKERHGFVFSRYNVPEKISFFHRRPSFYPRWFLDTEKDDSPGHRHVEWQNSDI